MPDTSTDFHQVTAWAQMTAQAQVWPLADQWKLGPGADMDLDGEHNAADPATLFLGVQAALVPSIQSCICSQDLATGKALQA